MESPEITIAGYEKQFPLCVCVLCVVGGFCGRRNKHGGGGERRKRGREKKGTERRGIAGL